MCPVHLDREKTTNLSQATNKLNNRTTRCVQYTWTGRKPPICHKPLINLITEQQDVSSTPGPGENHQSVTNPLINLITEQEDVSVHLDREKTTNLSQATNKLNNRATRCVQYTWTGRKPPICHKPLINLITEQQDVSSTPGPGENHQSVTSH